MSSLILALVEYDLFRKAASQLSASCLGKQTDEPQEFRLDAPRHRLTLRLLGEMNLRTYRDSLASPASIPTRFAQTIIVQRMIKNSAATVLAYYT